MFHMVHTQSVRCILQVLNIAQRWVDYMYPYLKRETKDWRIPSADRKIAKSNLENEDILRLEAIMPA